jgi:hypothetical protein
MRPRSARAASRGTEVGTECGRIVGRDERPEALVAVCCGAIDLVFGQAQHTIALRCRHSLRLLGIRERLSLLSSTFSSPIR